MEVRCPQCGHIQPVAEQNFKHEESISQTCSSCGKPFAVVNPKVATLRPETTRDNTPPISSAVGIDGRALTLPGDHSISLKVLEGREKGTVYPVTKPRMTIGRENADVIVDDKLSSRVHCELEISGKTVTLRDLDSTNGTFVEGKPVKTAELSGNSIFKIGGHAFQLVITPKQP